MFWQASRMPPRSVINDRDLRPVPGLRHDGGDHTLFLGEVRRFDYRDGDALGFINGQFTTIPQRVPGHEALL
jgi:flavin reductase